MKRLIITLVIICMGLVWTGCLKSLLGPPTIEPAGTNAKLASLTANHGVLLPQFSPTIEAYSIDVGDEVDSIALQAQAEDSNATVVFTPGKSFNLEYGENTATILVTAEDEETTKTYTVTVHRAPVLVTGITLDHVEINLKTTDSAQLTHTISPLNASNQAVEWSSDDDSIASVTNEGLVNAVGLGQTIITATTEDGNHAATCTVNVFSLTLSIAFEQPGDEEIDISSDDLSGISLAAGGLLEVAASDEYQSYAWYLNGVLDTTLTGSTFTIPIEDLALGAQSLNLVVVKNGVPYSKDLYFRIVP